MESQAAPDNFQKPQASLMDPAGSGHTITPSRFGFCFPMAVKLPQLGTLVASDLSNPPICDVFLMPDRQTDLSPFFQKLSLLPFHVTHFWCLS